MRENHSSGFANNKGADQPGHPHSLISTFVIHLFENINFYFLARFCGLADWFEYDLVKNPEDMLSLGEAHMGLVGSN